MLVGVVIDCKKNNACLISKEKGIFFWSEITMIKLGEKASDTLQQRQMKLVMCMLGLFHNLMMDKDEYQKDASSKRSWTHLILYDTGYWSDQAPHKLFEFHHHRSFI